LARGDAEEERKQIPLGAAEREGALESDIDNGTREAAQLGSGAPIKDLEREAKENEHRRSQQFKDHFELLSIIMLDVLFAGFILLAAVWVVHLVLPDHKVVGWAPFIHGWLSKDQLDHISGVLTTGVIAGLVADHFKRRIG
jgi:hypothetical protein